VACRHPRPHGGRSDGRYAAAAADPAAAEATGVVLSVVWRSIPYTLAAAGVVLLTPLIVLSLTKLAERE
jgi:hypothetical protein